ncbi:HHHH-motif protein [Variovorax sp. W6]|uniref:HHHH-motif protein n=1 Tax=Variovorax sp. W6 TaxID=3093895 RepID=UPI003D8066D2
MKFKQLAVSTIVALAGLAALAPSIASAAQHRARKVCHVDRYHHRVCHWVR